MKKAVTILFMFLVMTLLCTVTSTVHAEVDGNVKDLYENPEKFQVNESKENETSDTNEDVEISTSVTFFDYLKMVIALIFVVGLIYFLLKFINQRSRSFQQTKLIHHLGGSPLGGNRSVQLVKIGKRVLILGVGEDIQLLKEIVDEKEKAEIIHFYDESLPQFSGAKDVMSKWLKPVNRMNSTENKENSQPFQSVLNNQLEDIRRQRKDLLNELEGKENPKDE